MLASTCPACGHRDTYPGVRHDAVLMASALSICGRCGHRPIAFAVKKSLPVMQNTPEAAVREAVDHEPFPKGQGLDSARRGKADRLLESVFGDSWTED
jgi:hypothetical protein